MLRISLFSLLFIFALPMVADSGMDWFIQQGFLNILNEEGNSLYRLNADSYTHDAGKHQILIKNPHLTFRDPPDPAWHVTAEEGIIDETAHTIKGIQTVTLNHHVVAFQEKDAKGKGGVKINTEILIVLPKEHLIKSPVAISIQNDEAKTSGRDMTYNTQSEQLILHAPVFSQYDPKLLH